MKEKIQNFCQKGININVLKMIGILAMLLDHIGHYYVLFIPHELYSMLRIIGRIAMPIFVYSLVQGFFHTKNLKKYIIRIFCLAILTQIAISILGILNIEFVPEYTVNIYKNLNILFSFGFSLVLLDIIHNKKIFRKLNVKQNKIINIFIGIAIFVIYLFVPTDYGFSVILLALCMYYIEKFKISLYISRSTSNIKGMIVSSILENKIKVIYMTLIVITITMLIIYFNVNKWALLALIPIYLYNGEKGNDNILESTFYIFFPVHHIVLYTVALIITLILSK